MEVKKENSVPPILDQLKEYAETRVKLAKYQAIDKVTTMAASLIADVVAIIASVFAFIFFSLTLALLLAKLIGSYWLGFGCVTLVYLLIAVVIFKFKASIEKPIINAFIKKFFKK